MVNSAHADEFYIQAIQILNGFKISYLVGGAYAFRFYTGIFRNTKDLDIFMKKKDCAKMFRIFEEKGYRTKMEFSYWLAKIFSEHEDLIDVIFSSGNGICPVDDDWFKYARPGELYGEPVFFVPPEEMIWQKAFIMERLRYDGADVAHLIHSQDLDWPRLGLRFGKFWRVLLSHLILFGFIFPQDRFKIPRQVMKDFMNKLEEKWDHSPSENGLCQGTFLSLLEYLPDLRDKHFQDGRLFPNGKMTAQEIRELTSAFLKHS